MYLFRSCAGEGVDTYAALYSTDSFILSDDDDSGTYNNFMIPWKMTAGETYVFSARYLDDSTGSFSVVLEDSPVVGATFSNSLDVYEYSLGNFEQTDNGEYFNYYDWNKKLSYTVTMADGSTLSGIGNHYDYPLDDFDSGLIFQFNGNGQTYDNAWYCDKTYATQVSFLGETFDVEVTIVTPPEVEELALSSAHTCWCDDRWDETEQAVYTYYDWLDSVNGTIVIDGTTCDIFNGWFIYEDVEYRLWNKDSQGAADPWMIGETRTGETGIMNISATVSISVIEEGEDFVDIPDLEDMTELTLDSWYTAQIDIVDQKAWFKFTPSESGTYNFRSNAEDVDTYCDLYDSDYSYLGSDDDGGEHLNFQISHYLEAGKTYIFAARFLGSDTGSFPVILEKTLIASVTFGDVTVYKNMDGYYDTSWDEENGQSPEYFRYDWWNFIPYSVTMNDGATITGTGSGFNYNGAWYSFTFWDCQDYYNQMEVGHSYTCTVACGDYSQDVTITLEASPISSITIPDLTIEEFSNGYYSGYTDDDGNYQEFFHYNLYNALEGTVTFTDGSSKTFWGSGFSYQNKWYSLDIADPQSWENPWTMGNTYTATVSVGDISTTANITIVSYPITSIEIDPIALAAGESGYYETDEYGNSYFYYNWYNYNNLHYTATFNDGTVVTGSGTYIYNPNTERGYSLNLSDDQYNVHWEPGNTYEATVRAGSLTYPVYVSICTRNTEAGFTYLVQNDCAIITSCSLNSAVVNIPDTLGGYPVTGITDLGEATEYVKEITIPDSVTMLGSYLLRDAWQLQKVTIGSGAKNLTKEMLVSYYGALEEIVVSEDNAAYCSVDGVLYDKAQTTIVAYPPAKTSTHTVPSTVTNIDVLFDGSCTGISIDLGTNTSTGYVQEDGVIYNAAKTMVMLCSADKTGTYVMPDTVTDIAYMAFMNSSLEEVVISNNVTDITYHAFSGSTNLKKVTMPDTVKSIGFYAFSDCTSLAELNSNDSKTTNLPSGLQSLDSGAFASTALTGELTLPSAITYLPYRVFANTNFTSVVIPDAVTELDGGVFAGCKNLTSVSIGSGISYIPWNTFSGDTALTSIYLPENITSILSYAFSGCTSLAQVEFASDRIYISMGAFYNCPITDLDLPDVTEYIGDWAFYGSALEEVYIPQSVTDITYKSFANSTKLLNIDVPDNLNSLDGYAFENTAWFNSQADGPVYLENYLYGYKGNMPENYTLTIADGTTLVADSAFEQQMNLTTLNIPASLETFPYNAFRGCLNLQTVNIDAGSSFYMEDGILYDENGNAIWGEVTDVSIGVWCPDIKVGEEFHWNYAYARVEHADGYCSYITLSIEDVQISGFDSQKITNQEITITWNGYNAYVMVSILPPDEIDYLEIVDPVTEYALNQNWRYGNMSVIAHVGDQSYVVENYATSGFDTSTPGKKAVIVHYQDIISAEYTIYVSAEKTSLSTDTPVVDIVVDPVTGDETIVEYDVEVNVSNDIAGSAVLTIEKVDLDEELTVDVPAIIENSTNNVVFDITLVDSATGETIITGEEDPITVSIPVPGHMNGENCMVLYVKEDGTYEDLHAVFDGTHMVFDVHHFSYYALVEANVTYVAQIGDVMYTSLSEALTAAKSGDTVTLTADTAETYILVKPGVTLDLAGNTLTAQYVSAFNGSDVIDSIGGGLLTVDQSTIALAADNDQIPVWTGNGYVFTGFTFNQRIKESAEEYFVFQFKPSVSDSSVKTYLQSNLAESGLSVVVHLTWSSNGNTTSMDFTYNTETAQQVFSQGTLTLTVSGITGLEDLTATATIVSDTNVVASGETLSLA